MTTPVPTATEPPAHNGLMYTPDRRPNHCAYCGTRFDDTTSWPRDCPGCGETTWANPLPVAVTLLPVTGGDDSTNLLVVRRSIEPGAGLPALPGGYIELGETWQEAAARELDEESRIIADPADIELFQVDHSQRTIQVFGLLPRRHVTELPESTPTPEAHGWHLITGPTELAFPTHTRTVEKFFNAQGSSNDGG